MNKKLNLPSELTGQALLNHSFYTKGSAFSLEERERFHLQGLLPHRISTLSEQKERVYNEINRKSNALEKHIGLVALQNRNETLFYRVLLDHIKEFMPVVYTPTVGLACQRFSHIFRKVRGFWITPEHRGKMSEILKNSPFKDIRLIVATDNERILGLGDQGAGGIGIPVGKLSLYVVAAGINPSQTLPISLDVGTDNKELLNDPMYLGWRHPRLKGQAYYDFIHEFVEAVQHVFPKAVLQWEDFEKEHGFQLLQTYRHDVPSFNDDIQGTASVALACLLAACKKSNTSLEDQRVLILGAGAAGSGIAQLIYKRLERQGHDPLKISKHLALFDSKGLVLQESSTSPSSQEYLAWPKKLLQEFSLDEASQKDILSFIKAYKPTAIIGTSGQPGLLTEEMVRFMCTYTERPIIFPFSNPTKNSEATPHNLYHWTEGKAFVATGSPFENVKFKGQSIPVSQGNNVFVFPGIGLGAILAQSKRISDSMFYTAAKALQEYTDSLDIHENELLPSVDHLRAVTEKIALAIWKEADNRKLCKNKYNEEAAKKKLQEFMWVPEYVEYT